ncbi:cupin domain-containing protein [Rhodocaloribacter sp.]
MQMDGGNLFENIPPELPEEVFETLLEARDLRVERIVSKGQASPPGFWYDQPWHEWVLVLCGGARLEVEGEPGPVTLRPGDYLLLPAHRRHRVAWTDPDAETVWLALHFAP